jgi:adenosylmethionine-8-amino-7-oxononanoate aminotransferase
VFNCREVNLERRLFYIPILHLQNVLFCSLAYYLFMQGSYVYDINGNKYLDSLAGLWCTALGMCT